MRAVALAVVPAVAGKPLRFVSRSFSQFTLSPLSRSLEQATPSPRGACWPKDWKKTKFDVIFSSGIINFLLLVFFLAASGLGRNLQNIRVYYMLNHRIRFIYYQVTTPVFAIYFA